MNVSNHPKREQPSAESTTQQGGGKNAATPTDATGATRRANADDDKDEWRHEPVAPVDEHNPLKSLGRAVADVATGGSEAASNPKPPDR